MTRRFSDPRVTVLMTVFNGGEHMAGAIGSVLDQTYEDFELLIIDDGSTDGSSEFLRSIGDPRVRVVHQANRGRVPALNRGLAEASTELVACLDADDVAAPTRLASQVRFLDEHPTVAAVGSCYEVMNEKGTVQYLVHVAGESGYLRRQLYFRNVLAQSSMMFRLSAVRRAGGYREVGPAEDYDLWTRLALDHDLAALPEILLSYRLTRGSISDLAGARQPASLVTVRDQLHGTRPMVTPSAWTLFREGLAHRAHYSGTCARPLDNYVFDHAWLAVLAGRRGQIGPASRLMLGVLLLLLRHPGAILGLPLVAKLRPDRQSRVRWAQAAAGEQARRDVLRSSSTSTAHEPGC